MSDFFTNLTEQEEMPPTTGDPRLGLQEAAQMALEWVKVLDDPQAKQAMRLFAKVLADRVGY